MPAARSASPAKPKAAPRRGAAKAPAVAPPSEGVASEPAEVKAAAVPCAFPLEMRDGKCPVAVFHSPNSPNERISYAKGHVKPLAFVKGLLAVFTEREAAIVRQANPGGSTYLEGDPVLGNKPLVCKTCAHPTRWYDSDAYTRHTTFAHVN